MEELFVMALQVIFEAALYGSVCCGVPVEKAEASRSTAPLWISLILGAIIGGLSLIWLPDAMLPWGWLRVANLIVTPILVGGVCYAFAVLIYGRKAERQHLLHFVCSAAFGFAVALVRFVYAAKG